MIAVSVRGIALNAAILYLCGYQLEGYGGPENMR